MNISPIKTSRDYRNALREIEGLMTAKRNTPEGDRTDTLVTRVEAWSARAVGVFCSFNLQYETACLSYQLVKLLTLEDGFARRGPIESIKTLLRAI
jgi:hypothetical protein